MKKVTELEIDDTFYNVGGGKIFKDHITYIKNFQEDVKFTCIVTEINTSGYCRANYIGEVCEYKDDKPRCDSLLEAMVIFWGEL